MDEFVPIFFPCLASMLAMAASSELLGVYSWRFLCTVGNFLSTVFMAVHCMHIL